MKAILFRDVLLPEATLGSLLIAGRWFRTLERPWQDNQPNVSCIPAGEYECHFVERSASGKFRNVWWIRNVPERSGILFHSGNTVSASRGCPLLGLRRGWIAGMPAVLNSRSGMAELLRVVGPKGFDLEIIEAR